MQSITNSQTMSTLVEKQGSTSLKSGQILFGKVNKIFPNQTAEVQIGQQKMIAHLDIPLKVGERYWLQVQPDEGQITLKVLDSPSVNFSNIKGVVSQLLAHLDIQAEPEATKLADFLLKNQLPITKEFFSSALQWIKASDSTEVGLSVIKTMFAQQLPFVKDVFSALVEQVKNEPFHKLLSDLQQQLQGSGSDTKSAAQLKGILDSLHITKQNQLQQTGLQRLVATWLDSESASELKAGAFSLLQKIGFVPSGLNEMDFLKRAVTESVQMPLATNSSPANKLQQGLQLLALAYSSEGKPNQVENVESSLTKLWGGTDLGTITSTVSKSETQQKTITTDNRSTLTLQLIARAFTEVSASSKMTTVNPEFDELFIQLNKNIEQVDASKGKVGELLLQTLKEGQEIAPPITSEGKVLAHLVNDEFPAIDFTNGTVVAQELKKMTKLLGLQLEHVLANISGDKLEALTKDLETLKPLLLKLLNEQHPAVVKDIAEQLLNRLTAQQVLSQDNGPIQNLLLTLPLNLGSSQTDLTMQWSGRKTKDGKIDPDYCRILFYLELESLKETIIDMQIQNRIIKVMVVNEESEAIQASANNYLDELKVNLKKMDYQLSGVLFQNSKNVDSKQSNNPFSETETYSGVDIRI